MRSSDHTLPRLFVRDSLSLGAELNLSQNHVHYLGRVLRRQPGDGVRVFNGQDGEWRVTIGELGKRMTKVICDQHLRPQQSTPDVWVVFAPVKKTGTDFIVEKATELGASKLIAVKTARAQSDRFNIARLQARAIEAAEQCERLDVPEIVQGGTLEDLLSTWDPARHLFIMDETGPGTTLAQAVTEKSGQPAALLIGPEGGWTDGELDRVAKMDFTISASLGPRILRAETAVAAGLAIWQALAGDSRS